ncbi:MAG: tRNA pseudouridine(55) synthase TruB [Gemmataceae bacterium]|nr:tRNA pseudouridine(55) synthase TruB [Gemmataceae bacterium]MDW8263839.1 tRNA pseudouridine(55) synthase TruB [Gemmataceae bacterium]
MPASCEGILVVDKPAGLTSREAVDRAQRWFPRRTRVGHAGTLDPLATGVLVLAVGRATRLIEYVQRMSKTYRAEIGLGARSDTDDVDGTITPVPVGQVPSRAVVEAALARFVGDIEQVPPRFSATRIAGRRAYDLARHGADVDLVPRRVRIEAIRILDYAYPRLEVEVQCGKGTYIRSLARDLGEALGCGGLIRQLRRTQVGPFTVTDALSLDADAATAQAALLPLIAAVSELPSITLSSPEIERLVHGQGVAARVAEAEEWAVLDGQGHLRAVARWEPARKQLMPVKVLT